MFRSIHFRSKLNGWLWKVLYRNFDCIQFIWCLIGRKRQGTGVLLVKTKMNFCLHMKDTLSKVIYICKHNATNEMFSLNLLNTRWSPEIIIIQQIDTLTPDNYFLLISTHINVPQNKLFQLHTSLTTPTPPLPHVLNLSSWDIIILTSELFVKMQGYTCNTDMHVTTFFFENQYK